MKQLKKKFSQLCNTPLNINSNVEVLGLAKDNTVNSIN